VLESSLPAWSEGNGKVEHVIRIVNKQCVRHSIRGFAASVVR
jgi:hypothetical protein